MEWEDDCTAVVYTSHMADSLLKCNILCFVEVYYANEHTIQNDWLIRNEAAKVHRMGV